MMATKPWGLPPLFDNVPQSLKDMERWVCWRADHKPDGKVSKIPLQASGFNASTHPNKSHTWTTFDKAVAAYLKHQDEWSGIGLVLSGLDRPITVLDLDKCVDPEGGPADWAKRLVEAAGSYAELSPSNRGARVFLFTEEVPFINHEQGLEVYTEKSTRFVTVTGHHIGISPDDVTEGTPDLHEELDYYRPPLPVAGSEQAKVSDTPKQIERTLEDLLEASQEFEHYKPWLDMGMALHHQFDGAAEGLDMWDRLCQRLDNYNPDELERKWDSFGGGGGRQLTLRTLFKDAKGHGIDIRPKLDPGEFPIMGDEEPVVSTPSPEADTKPAVATAPWLMNGEQMLHAKPPIQIVEDLFGLRQVSMISGAPGAGKSFLALHLAYAVARGDKFFGRRVMQGPVLYLAFEGVAALQQRARGIESAMGRKWPDQLYCGTPEIALTDQGWASKMGEQLLPVKPKLIIIDTLSAAMMGGSTSDEQLMSTVQGMLRRWATKWNTHVCVVHHPPKGGGSTGSIRSRGSSVIEGDLDTMLYVMKDSKTNVCMAEVEKQRLFGSVGDQFDYKLIGCTTSMLTQWGAERSAYLSEDVTPEDKMDPNIESLRVRLRDAIRSEGGVQLDAGGWETVKEAWLASLTDLRDATQEAVKQRVKRAVSEISNEFHFIRAGNRQIRAVEFAGRTSL